MNRYFLGAALALALPAFASAHMVYVVPSADGKTVTVVFSDSLEPDENVAIDKVAGLKLVGRSADGRETPVECDKSEHRLTANLDDASPQVVYGSVTYGLLTRTEKPTLMIYHPKAIIPGDGNADGAVGGKAAVEIVPVTAEGKTRFRLLVSGKPVAAAEGSVMLPDGSKEKVVTDEDGYTPALEPAGRYAVWLKHTEAKAGEYLGKKYDETRHYATLVTDVKE